MWKNEYNYFAPRFGFAYRLPQRMVIRGGYGIFYSAAQFDNVNILQLNPPNGGSLTVINPDQKPDRDNTESGACRIVSSRIRSSMSYPFHRIATGGMLSAELEPSAFTRAEQQRCVGGRLGREQRNPCGYQSQ